MTGYLWILSKRVNLLKPGKDFNSSGEAVSVQGNSSSLT